VSSISSPEVTVFEGSKVLVEDMIIEDMSSAGNVEDKILVAFVEDKVLIVAEVQIRITYLKRFRKESTETGTKASESNGLTTLI
jgi:hypothetical protein